MTASGSVSFTNNSASANGGGAFVVSRSVTLGMFTAYNNADNQDGEMIVSESVLFTENSANYGGGFTASSSNVTIGNALFTTNHADSQGGGIDFKKATCS